MKHCYLTTRELSCRGVLPLGTTLSSATTAQAGRRPRPMVKRTASLVPTSTAPSAGRSRVHTVPGSQLSVLAPAHTGPCSRTRCPPFPACSRARNEASLRTLGPHH
jgi:hypothetical protein